MDHDRLFKELLITFFREFLALFLPELSAALDPDFTIVPMDKEVFTDVTQGEKHEVDILMKAKFQGQEAFFLIHVENQATPQAEFPKRMFRYFARLTEKYDLPVYPVVIFSYDTPKREEPDRWVVRFPGKTVLRFEYTVIQLNRLSWKRFLQQENPVASALMAKMKMSVKDRPRVKAECLRLLASLKLDPARTTLIGGFIDSYLKLSAKEMKQYERRVSEFAPTEKEETVEIITSWHEAGIKEGMALGITQGKIEGLSEGISQGISQGKTEGLHEGKEKLVMRLLRRRVGNVPSEIAARLDTLSPEQLDDLGEALLDFSTVADLEQWLAR